MPNIGDPASFRVQPGQRVRPVFNLFLDCLESLRILGGVGVLITRKGRATCINARSAVRSFTGAFFVLLNGPAVTLGIGLVNGVEAVIGTTPVSGDARGQVPILKLSASLYTAGQTWIALEVETDAAGKMDSKKPPRIVQLAKYPISTGTIARHALATLRISATAAFPGQLHQITYFDLQHSTSVDAQGALRHFFSPA